MSIVLLAVALVGAGCESDFQFPELARTRGLEVAAEVDGRAVRDHVYALVDARRDDDEVELPSWGGGMPLRRVASATYVTGVFEGLGLEPVVDHSDDGGVEVTNVYVDFPGATRPDELVLVTAHHDAWYFGANDNGSGVAVVLEMARILTNLDAPTARTIRLVAFDREEEGLVGSRRYYEARKHESVAALINLDAIGFTNPEPGSQESLPGVPAPSTGEFGHRVRRGLGDAGAQHGRRAAGACARARPARAERRRLSGPGRSHGLRGRRRQGGLQNMGDRHRPPASIDLGLSPLHFETDSDTISILPTSISSVYPAPGAGFSLTLLSIGRRF